MNAGTYRWIPATISPGLKRYEHGGLARDKWELNLSPDVRMRARRVFGRTQQTRSLTLTLADTTEVCRDITWFAERYPLKPYDITSEQRLRDGAARHRAMETLTKDALAGRATRLPVAHEPAIPPREYQQIAVDLLRARGVLLLTDEVGLGKTFTGLLAAASAGALPALVVPPTHLPRRWETELRESFPTITWHTVKGTRPDEHLLADLPDVLIVPYTRLDGWAGHLAGRFETVIFDEPQDLRRGIETNKGKAAALVTADATYVLGLTATPIYNYGGEIWNILDILAPGVLGTHEEFTREWASSSIRGNTLVDDPEGLGAYLRTEGIMLGRTRADVGRELPETIKVTHEVDANYAALLEAEDIVKALAEKILASDTTSAERFTAAGEIDWRVRQATGVDKARGVAAYCRMLLESEERIVLWGWHRAVYDIWMEELADFRPLLYTGSESPAQKARAEELFTTPIDWQNPLDLANRVLIMSLRSGAGVDGLQKVARVGVFGELDWSPEVHEQGIGRLRRDGMGDDPPVIYFLTSHHGSDPALMEVLGIKRQQSEPLVNPDGQLYQATHDNNRARLLAEQVLGRREQHSRRPA